MKKIVSSLIFLFIISFHINAQIYYGAAASDIIDGTEMIKLDTETLIPVFIKFKDNHKPSLRKLDNWLRTNLNISNNLGLELIGRETDKSGQQHYRHRQTYNQIPIHDAIFIVHVNSEKIESINGKIVKDIPLSFSNNLSIDQARNKALAFVNAEIYKWQIPTEETLLKREMDDESASYYPQGELMIVNFPNSEVSKLAYRFEIYAHKPLSKAEYFVNAENGKIELVLDMLHFADATGSAATKYSGTQNIMADNNAGIYRLRETGRGNGIETYNMQMGTDYGTAIDFTDNDNYWNNVNADMDEVATDAHWATEMTYDYYYIVHGRNSIDNNGFRLKSYVHFNLVDYGYGSNNNAFWDGTRMTYGDGESPYTPLTTVDICGHEITHGLTSNTANLSYSYESGALNEAYSDIFGTLIEFYAKPTDANWTIAEDIGGIFRSLSDPNSRNQPDTYHGQYWNSGSGDNGGVHTNSGVLNYWFYLLTVGGSGTNDNGNSYTVAPLGMDVAADIAFRTLTVYLTSNSQYDDARFYSIMSAIDMFGACSPEVEAVTNAFYAVGVGSEYVPYVVSDYSSDFQAMCDVPSTISFFNESVNGTSFIWNFGDGATSNAISPSHTYTTFGTFDVSLIADGGTCGIDTFVQTEFISINGANPCITLMPPSGSATETNCYGTLYDIGGGENYPDNANSTITIAPGGATQLTLVFSLFDYETDYDTLYIYDGPNTGSPLIGGYTGNSLPNGGTIVSSGGSICLRHFSDQGVTNAGFICEWACFYPNIQPVSDFVASSTSSCSGIIDFTDHSLYGPTSWLWYFGDGTTSAQQNPSHIYDNSGVYTVSLVSCNQYGCDSASFNNIITVEMPAAPTVLDAEICGSGAAQLSASGIGNINWYASETDEIILYTGSVYDIPFLSETTTYFVSDQSVATSQYTGKPDNSGGGSYFGNISSVHYLVFDCFTPIELLSVKVYASGAANRHIALRDASFNIIQEITVFVPDGESRVDLNFDIPIGTNLQLVGMESPDLYRNNSGVAYPFDLPGLLSIKHSSASTAPTDYYYFFYDWEVREPICTSPRVAVTVDVINIEDILASDLIYTQQPDTIILDAGAGFDGYEWQDGSLAQTYNVVDYGWYYVTVSLGGCTRSDSIFVDFEVGNGEVVEIGSETEIYPNPGNDILFIKVRSNSSANLLSLQGQLLYSFELKKDVNKVDFSRFAVGVYLLSITTLAGTETKKIIIQR